jgi:hypothetical protein
MCCQIVVEDCPGKTTAWFWGESSVVVDIRLIKTEERMIANSGKV